MSDDDAATLSAGAARLGERVAALTLSVDQVAHRTQRSERITVGVVLGLALDLILSVAVGLVLVGQANTSTRLEQAIAREATTRQEALCPLYGLFIGSFNPNSRAAGPDREKYVAAFEVLRESYATLDCTAPIVPPRSDPPPR